MEYWETYDKHYQAMNPGQDAAAYAAFNLNYLDAYLPADKGAALIDVGCGSGMVLYYLHSKGYANLDGIDLSAGQVDAARKALGDKARLEHAGADVFFRDKAGRYDQIFLFDVIEHVRKENMTQFLIPLVKGLKPGGSLVIRTPNMANVLGAYSRYLDITHEVGFTEYSLNQVMLSVGATRHAIIDENRYCGWKRRIYLGARNYLYRRMYKLDIRTMPTVFDKNIMMAFYF